MPTNKNAQLRYQILDRCFSDFSRMYTIDDLKDKINKALEDLYGTGISIRQVREDIKYMRDIMTYDAPIVAYPFFEKKCYYRYSNPRFSIFNNELSEDEITKLRATIDMLSRYRGMSTNAWLEEVISNLEIRFGVKPNRENVVVFEQNEQLKGLEFLSEIIDATLNHRPLLIVYRSYNGNETESLLHPYLLKQYNNRWFLFGLEENAKHGNRITNRPLDRIVKFSVSNGTKFIPNKDINFKEFFKDIVGVTIPEDHPTPEKVVLRFDKQRFPYIVSKPIHHSQEIINEEEHTVSLFIRPNKELDSLILSYGPQVEVIEPKWFRERISEKINESYKKYFPMQNGCTE